MKSYIFQVITVFWHLTHHYFLNDRLTPFLMSLCVFIFEHESIQIIINLWFSTGNKNFVLKDHKKCFKICFGLNKDVLRVDVQRIVLHQRYRYSAFEPCVHPPTWRFLQKYHSDAKLKNPTSKQILHLHDDNSNFHMFFNIFW